MGCLYYRCGAEIQRIIHPEKEKPDLGNSSWKGQSALLVDFTTKRGQVEKRRCKYLILVKEKA